MEASTMSKIKGTQTEKDHFEILAENW